MLSYDEDSTIAVTELNALKRTLEELLGEKSSEGLDILKIEEFCLGRYEKWKRLNAAGSNGNFDRLLRGCIEGILAGYDDKGNEWNDLVVSKFILISSNLFECISRKDEDFQRLWAKYSLVLDRIIEVCCVDATLDQANFEPEHSDDHQGDNKSMETKYFIVETIMKLQQSESSYEKTKTMVLNFLRRAAATGDIKIVAKICSNLFPETMVKSSGGPVELFREGIRVLLSHESTDDQNTIEARCVGVHCLAKTMVQLNDLPLQECRKVLVIIVKRYLVSDKILVRKCGRSLVAFLFEDRISVDVFKEYLVLLEALELKQVHMLTPAFGSLDRLVRACEETGNRGDDRDSFDVSWLLLVFYNALHHRNSFVIKWAIGKYFELNPHSIPGILGHLDRLGHSDCQFFFNTVFPVLGSNDIYYRFSIEGGLRQFVINMETFFRAAIQIGTPIVFWRQWLETMRKHRMAPAPLFYISHTLRVISHDEDQPAVFKWMDIRFIRTLFWEFSQIPQLFMRAAVQEANLEILFNLCDWSQEFLFEYCNTVLSMVPSSLVHPGKARHFCQRENPRIWIKRGEFMETLLSALSMDGNSNSWCNEALQALVIIVNAVSPHNVYRHWIVQFLTERDYSGIALITAFLKVNPEHFCLLTGPRPLLVLAVDQIIEQANSDEDLNVTNFRTYSAFVKAALNEMAIKRNPKHEAAVQQQFLRLKEMLLSQQKGEIRKYFTAQIYRLVLEHAVERHVHLGNVDDVICFADLSPPDDSDLQELEGQLEPGERNRIRSEYTALKWRFLLCAFKMVPLKDGDDDDDDDDDKSNLVGWCEGALDDITVISGADDVHVVIQCLGYILPKILPFGREVVGRGIRQLFITCDEQKKSDQSLETVRQCCTAVFQPKLMFCTHEEVLNEMKTISDTFIAELDNPSLACCLSQVINNAVAKMDKEKYSGFVGQGYLLETLVELCCFGPILKKDRKVLYDAGELIHEFGACIYNCVKTQEGEHLACQKTRFFAFHTVLILLEKFDLGKEEAASFLVELVCKKLQESISGAVAGGYYANSLCHRVRTRAVQLLLLMEPFIVSASLALRLQKFTLCYLTENNQQPSVRLMLEWLMTRLNIRFVNYGLLEKWWEAEEYMLSRRAGTLCTWMGTLMHVGLCLPEEQRRRHFLECVKRWLPWCTAQNFTLRCCAQASLQRLWKEEKLDRFGEDVKCKANSDSDSDNSCTDLEHELEMVWKYTRSAVFFNKEDRNNTKNVEKASKDFYFSIFNAVSDYSLQTVFNTFPRLCFMPPEELIPVSWWQSLPSGGYSGRIPVENERRELNLEHGDVYVWRDRAAAELAESSNQASSYKSLQTKTNSAGSSSSLRGLVRDLDDGNSVKDDRLIVVATLIDSIPNLGGLCRTCEIFGVSEYAISNLRTTEHAEFQSLSVTSEKWVNITEVKPVNLASYLNQKHEDGYTLVAVEQTTTSRQLTDYKFPPKTLLLLGNEREGIPVDLLQYVDTRVEVPQIGRIRSLNVHVAGALIVWEYAKQWRFK